MVTVGRLLLVSIGDAGSGGWSGHSRRKSLDARAWFSSMPEAVDATLCIGMGPGREEGSVSIEHWYTCGRRTPLADLWCGPIQPGLL